MPYSHLTVNITSLSHTTNTVTFAAHACRRLMVSETYNKVCSLQFRSCKLACAYLSQRAVHRAQNGSASPLAGYMWEDSWLLFFSGAPCIWCTWCTDARSEKGEEYGHNESACMTAGEDSAPMHVVKSAKHMDAIKAPVYMTRRSCLCIWCTDAFGHIVASHCPCGMPSLTFEAYYPCLCKILGMRTRIFCLAPANNSRLPTNVTKIPALLSTTSGAVALLLLPDCSFAVPQYACIRILTHNATEVLESPQPFFKRPGGEQWAWRFWALHIACLKRDWLVFLSMTDTFVRLYAHRENTSQVSCLALMHSAIAGRTNKLPRSKPCCPSVQQLVN